MLIQYNISRQCLPNALKVQINYKNLLSDSNQLIIMLTYDRLLLEKDIQQFHRWKVKMVRFNFLAHNDYNNNDFIEQELQSLLSLKRKILLESWTN
jgi:hypothetical protein